MSTDTLVLENTLKTEAISEVSPADAVLQLQPRFRRAARKMAKDYHLRLELVQEMSLAVLRCRKSNKLAWFRKLGDWRAADYLRHISNRPQVWIDKAARIKDNLIGDREFNRIVSVLLAEG